MNDDDVLYEQRLDQFERLCARTAAVLSRFGQRDSFFRDGGFSLVEDYWGHPQVKVNILDLNLLRPNVVAALRATVADFPGWEIVAAVTVREHYEDWPEMGLYIRAHEIVDGLQRRYFPKEFRDIEYAGSRPGTQDD